MAEITLKSKTQNKGSLIVKRQVHSTKVDLTPMVDLGFLLITFFIFTTAMSQPMSMKLVMPDESGEPMPIRESGALTLIPSYNGSVYYYEGKLEVANFKKISLYELRNVILEKKASTKEKDFFVVIKPGDQSSYGDIVKVLDEMKINEVKRYTISRISKLEENIIK